MAQKDTWQAFIGISAKSRTDHIAGLIASPELPHSAVVAMKQELREVLEDVERVSGGDLPSITSIVSDKFTLDNLVSAYQFASEVPRLPFSSPTDALSRFQLCSNSMTCDLA